MKEKVLYKVVKYDRASISLNPKIHPSYIRYYKKGKIVEAKPGSMGLFLFRSKKHALNFAAHTADIIAVIPLDEVKKCPSFRFNTDAPFYNFYKKIKNFYLNRNSNMNDIPANVSYSLPEGTVVCNKVKVIE